MKEYRNDRRGDGRDGRRSFDRRDDRRRDNRSFDDRREDNRGFSDGGAPVFYLRGGYAPDKLKGLHKLLMKPMAKSVVQEIQDKGHKATESELEMMNLFLYGGDCFDEKQLDPIVQWFQTGPHDGKLAILPNATL